MIESLTLKNFKSIKEETFNFTRFDLLVGRNNSGKSTILQALAIWQYCVDEFHRSNRKGSKGIQVVLPNFTALPLPAFNLLWTDTVDRQYPKISETGEKKQEFILIEIVVRWKDKDLKIGEFGVQLRYQSPQSVYAIPGGGWKKFKELDNNDSLPKIVYVPPFSGLEPYEEWRDDSILKKQVGKAQPGSVLRNLLFRVVDKPAAKGNEMGSQLPPGHNSQWQEIKRIIDRLFSVEITPPQYEKGIDTQITCTYKPIEQKGKKEFDIISGGSGFHQTLTILAFMYGYEGVTTILFDEPDAHMHTNLQREILDFLKIKSKKENIQFIIATHAEELIRGVHPTNIISVLKTKSERIEATPKIISALSDVSNLEITHLTDSPYILYVEGETDERIIRAWAVVLKQEEILKKFFIKHMGGGSKKTMKENCDEHFNGLRQIIPQAQRMMLFDYDNSDNAFHPGSGEKNLSEWQRKNIENYLLVKDSWHRAAINNYRLDDYPIFQQAIKKIINEFFEGENLTLPKGKAWQTLSANIFSLVDGKKILFEDSNSLYQQLKKSDESLNLNQETIASHMTEDEIHEDVMTFFDKLEALTKE